LANSVASWHARDLNVTFDELIWKNSTMELPDLPYLRNLKRFWCLSFRQAEVPIVEMKR